MDIYGIKISRNGGFVCVTDNDVVICHGNTPQHHAFAQNVQRMMYEQGYALVVQDGVTYAMRRPHNTSEFLSTWDFGEVA